MKMKKATVYIIFMLVSFFSANAQKIDQCTICGKFYKLVKGKDFSTSYTLELNADSTFKLFIRVFDGSPQCQGKWKFMGDKFVILNCSEDDNPYQMLTNGYMSQRNDTIQIISKNKIRFNDAVLKRKD